MTVHSPEPGHTLQGWQIRPQPICYRALREDLFFFVLVSEEKEETLLRVEWNNMYRITGMWWVGEGQCEAGGKRIGHLLWMPQRPREDSREVAPFVSGHSAANCGVWCGEAVWTTLWSHSIECILLNVVYLALSSLIGSINNFRFYLTTQCHHKLMDDVWYTQCGMRDILSH